MNEKKVCFIFCSNDKLYTEECLYYINHLHIPEGYQVDALAIEGAVSMAAGYNEGMQASDAKYKVYLHQDVFIVNPDFIQDFIDIFRKDARIGMIGMIGSPRLPDSGIMWDDERCGAIYVPAYNKDPLFRAGGEDVLTEVEAVDGLLMITQYDIPWREDLFDKWDFYDCSQSQEFIRHGYRIVVPWMKEPWCLHDSTISYMTSYDGERQKFLQEYFAPEGKLMDARQLRQQVDRLLRDREYDSIKTRLLSNKDTTEHDNDLAMICYLCTIHEREKEAGQPTLFTKIADVDELLERYTALKFYLRRIDFDILDELESFYQFLLQNQVSSYELLRAIDFGVVNRDKVLQVINEGALPVKRADEGAVKSADSAQEFCFIICTNNAVYAQECIHYINHLHVPDGIQVNVLTVEEAKSLTSAYNEAMQCSRAKYKVYLHHDTFIINRDFISDCLRIFRTDPRIGMIGNVGVEKMPSTGVMWDADRFGMLYEQHIYETKLLANAFSQELPYMEVDAIDGFLMVTQYDIPWREDLFCKWDFYDCSQSMEFKRKGYRVVVPWMNEPWCVHDCGFINLQNYDGEKEKFIAEYLTE